MPKYADYIKRIEIDSLWSGKKHIVWDLNRQVNILSGSNGQGKSTILNKVVKGLAAGGEFPSHMLKGVKLDVVPEDAKWIRYDLIRSLDSNLQQTFSENTGFITQAMTALAGVGAGSLLDMQLFQLQRKYLDYQVNIGNRIIEKLQAGDTEAAQQMSQKKYMRWMCHKNLGITFLIITLRLILKFTLFHSNYPICFLMAISV